MSKREIVEMIVVCISGLSFLIGAIIGAVSNNATQMWVCLVGIWVMNLYIKPIDN